MIHLLWMVCQKSKKDKITNVDTLTVTTVLSLKLFFKYIYIDRCFHTYLDVNSERCSQEAFQQKYNATCDQYCQKGAGPSVRPMTGLAS